jgi:hypothetical protein
MARSPANLQPHINSAYPGPNPVLIASVQPDGFAQVTPRGSVVVVDDNTLGYWNRGGGTTAKNMSDGGKVTVFFRNPDIREILPGGGIARFYGTATIHTSGPMLEKVWSTMVQVERDKDPEKQGHAVLVKVERAEDLGGRPLAGSN